MPCTASPRPSQPPVRRGGARARRCVAALLGVVLSAAIPAALARDTRRLFAPEPQDRDTETVSLRDFCRAADGTGDDTACFQAAVDSLCAGAAGGGTLRVPRGTYAISAAVGITVPCPGLHIIGQGWGDRDTGAGGTRIVVTGRGDRPIFDFRAPIKPGDRYFYGGSLRDLQFYSHNPAGDVGQLGAMVQFSHCFGCSVEHVYSFNAYRFVLIFAGFDNRVTQFFADQIAVGGEAIKAHGSDAGCGPDAIGACPTRADVVAIDHGAIDAALAPGTIPGACIRLSNFVATTMIGNVVCNQTNIGLNIDCPDSASLAACPQFISAWDFEAEVNGGGSPDAAAGLVGTDIVHLNCQGCHFYGYGATTLVILAGQRFAGASDAQFVGGTVEGARGSCVRAAMQGLEWHGGQVHNCGQGGGAAYAFDIGPSPNGGADASGSTIIEGTRLCLGIGSAPTAMGGVLLEPGTDFNVITGNVLRGCTVGVTDRSGGAHEVVANNAGP